jgi:hypothetical protein
MKKIVIVTRTVIHVDDKDHENEISQRRLAAKNAIIIDKRSDISVTITEWDGTTTKLSSPFRKPRGVVE